MIFEINLQIATIIFFAGLLIGYVWGRHDGKQEGFSLGFAYAPLEMRRQVLIKGVCLTCGRRLSPEEGRGPAIAVVDQGK